MGLIAISDRKLMPMAAKAADIKVELDEEDGRIASYWNELGDVWEPLSDRDDAARLAEKLCDNEIMRLAIVRAAAEIGAMKP
ncbi:hypothetical protein RAM80_07580 [Pseudomonas sp. App30]|uniref:hypothetical protein n=1 Tax=Pseudomonas sp. App30 TaxID=3068990 RepID=UPI003A807F2A